MLLATIRSLYLGMYLSPITSVHHCKGLARIYHLHVCFGRARFADEGKNCTEHLHKAYLIDNLILPYDCSSGDGWKDQQGVFTFCVDCNEK